MAPKPRPAGSTARVPEGEWTLVPRPVYDAIRGAYLHADHGFILRHLTSATRAWRWWTLLARPAWLSANVVGNTAQAVTAGAGPVAFTRAAMGKYRDATPTNAANKGLFATQLGEQRGLSGLGVASSIRRSLEEQGA